MRKQSVCVWTKSSLENESVKVRCVLSIDYNLLTVHISTLSFTKLD